MLKQVRRVATRHGKPAASFLPSVERAALSIWTQDVHAAQVEPKRALFAPDAEAGRAGVALVGAQLRGAAAVARPPPLYSTTRDRSAPSTSQRYRAPALTGQHVTGRSPR